MMAAKIRFALFIMLTAVCGGGVVYFETPLNLLLFIVWGVILMTASRLSKGSDGKRAVHLFPWHAATMACIITAAAFAPVKRIDAVLKRSVELDRQRMTLAHLANYCLENRQMLPLRIYVPSSGRRENSEITFSSTTMPLQQFIAEVEQQTGCHHHFSGCGNAYTVLYGNAYNFGLLFIPSPDSIDEWK